MTINSVRFDAEDEILNANMFNDPAEEGYVDILVNATIDYVGDSDEGKTPMARIQYVTPSGNTVSRGDGTMNVAPESLDTSSPLYHGASISGNIVLTIPQEGAEEGVLAVSPGMGSNKKFMKVI